MFKITLPRNKPLNIVYIANWLATNMGSTIDKIPGISLKDYLDSFEKSKYKYTMWFNSEGYHFYFKKY